MSGAVRYEYVGPADIRATAQALDVLIAQNRQTLDAWLSHRPGQATFTYVVDLAGLLRLAPRHSEHVACAAGAEVLAAGEITFDTNTCVVSVSNQSAGYCPEPQCWQRVADALETLRIDHPGGFTEAMEFRRCATCTQINIVRDCYFVCAVCDSELPAAWNFAGG